MVFSAIFFVVWCFQSIYCVDFKKFNLISRKLCNNDPREVLSQKCFNAEYTAEVECDSRKIDKNGCNQLNITSKVLTEKLLTEIGVVVDNDNSVRRITIDASDIKVTNLTVLGGMIDNFLLARPVWSVVAEPFNVTDPARFVFERYTQLWDTYFEQLTRLQFPSPEVCAKSLMIISKADCVHPGFSDVRKRFYYEMGGSSIMSAVFVPKKDLAGFVSDCDCPPEHRNRWTCAFLQMTNCTLPQEVATSKNNGIGLYNSSSLGGNFIHTHSGIHQLVDHAKTVYEEQGIPMLPVVDVFSLPPFVYTSPFANASNMFKFHGPEDYQVPEFIFMEFLFRKNAFFRRRVAEMLAGFRAKYNLGNAIRTKERKFVAVHLRRSDRLKKGVNMTEFCHNLLVQRFTHIPQNCTYEDGEVRPCQGNENVLGCNEYDDVPFGSVTLDAAVQEAEMLIGPSIRNMIVFSEDVEWLEAETATNAKLHPKWKFYTLDANKEEDVEKHKVEHIFHTRSGGTAAGVLFHATIDLVQECDELLGHFNSGVPMTFAGAMCHHHAGMEGICPPVYNLKFKL